MTTQEHNNIHNNNNNNNSTDEAAKLMAEIARIEAELQAKQQLEAEIKAMEDAIAQAQAQANAAHAPPQVAPPQSQQPPHNEPEALYGYNVPHALLEQLDLADSSSHHHLSSPSQHRKIKRVVRSVKPAKRASLLNVTLGGDHTDSSFLPNSSSNHHPHELPRISLKDENDEQAAALLAQQARRKLDQELVQMERAIGRHRRMSVEFQAYVEPTAVPKFKDFCGSNSSHHHHHQYQHQNHLPTSPSKKTITLKIDPEELQRQKLEAEIRAMEHALAEQAQQQAAQQQQQEQAALAAEIHAMEQAIAQAQAQAAAGAAAKEAERQKQEALAAEIKAMEDAIAAAQAQVQAAAEQDEFASDDAAPAARPALRLPQLNLMESIVKKAAAREQRLEDTGGELIMQDIAPEVAEQRQTTPQLAFSMAELVSKKARERDERIHEQGGELKITILKPKEEYKQEFKSIVVEAAELGRLTKLNEYIVESVAVEKTPEQEWRSNGLIAIQWRSNHMAVIQQAAAFGAATKLPEKVVSNFPDEEQQENWDDAVDEDQPMTPAQLQLMKLNSKAGTGQLKIDNVVMNRKEVAASKGLVRPMYMYEQIDELILPKRELPKIDTRRARERYLQKQKYAAEQHRPLTDVSNEVAAKAWERRARLDRPNVLPKVTEGCKCAYCISPSPYQTYAYKLLREGKLSHDDDKEHAHMSDRERQAKLRKMAEKQKRQAENPFGIDAEEYYEQHREQQDDYQQYSGIAAQRAKFSSPSKSDSDSSGDEGHHMREKKPRVYRKGRKKEDAENIPPSSNTPATASAQPTPPPPPAPVVETPPPPPPPALKQPEASVAHIPEPGTGGCGCTIM